MDFYPQDFYSPDIFEATQFQYSNSAATGAAFIASGYNRSLSKQKYDSGKIALKWKDIFINI